ncbi:GPI transamidase component Gaa1 [Babesia duncani]|nr:GPI transamidase component Gaa1 [Babesia duncani]
MVHGHSLLVRLRCPRCSFKSCLVVVVTIDFRRECDNLVGASLAVALMRFLSKINTIGQDLLVIFVDSGLPFAAGTRQFLNDYYGDPTFPMRSANFHSALVIDIGGSSLACRTLDIDYHGIDGRVPSQDVLNVLVKEAAFRRLNMKVHGFWQSLISMATNANAHRHHIPFVDRNVHAVSISCKNGALGKNDADWSIDSWQQSFDSLVRALGQTIRNLGHLDTAPERASNLYIQDGPEEHVEIGTYGLVIPLLIFPLAAQIIRLHAPHFMDLIKGLAEALTIVVATCVPSHLFLLYALKLQGHEQLTKGAGPKGGRLVMQGYLHAALGVALLCYILTLQLLKALNSCSLPSRKRRQESLESIQLVKSELLAELAILEGRVPKGGRLAALLARVRPILGAFATRVRWTDPLREMVQKGTEEGGDKSEKAQDGGRKSENGPLEASQKSPEKTQLDDRRREILLLLERMGPACKLHAPTRLDFDERLYLGLVWLTLMGLMGISFVNWPLALLMALVLVPLLSFGHVKSINGLWGLVLPAIVCGVLHAWPWIKGWSWMAPFLQVLATIEFRGFLHMLQHQLRLSLLVGSSTFGIVWFFALPISLASIHATISILKFN